MRVAAVFTYEGSSCKEVADQTKMMPLLALF
jgi:hypothetical protein